MKKTLQLFIHFRYPLETEGNQNLKLYERRLQSL